jgi:hypothetical protein
MLPPSSGRTGSRFKRPQIQETPAEIDEDQRAKRVPSERGIGHAYRVHQHQRQRSNEDAYRGTGGAHDEASPRTHWLALLPPRQATQSDELDAWLPSERPPDQGMAKLVHQDALEHHHDPDQQAGPALVTVQGPKPERHQPEPQMNADWDSEQAELDAHRMDYGSRPGSRPGA